jgi:hypothetical protein
VCGWLSALSSRRYYRELDAGRRAHQAGRNTAAKCLLLFVPSLGGGRSAAAAVGVISMQKPLRERVVTRN